MPSLRSLILAMPVILGATLISAPISTATASALPIAFPVIFRNADYGASLAPIERATRYKRSNMHSLANHTKTSSSKHHAITPVNSSPARHRHSHSSAHNTFRTFRRDASDMDDMLQSLSGRRDKMKSDSQDLQEMASPSASKSVNDPDFRQNAAAKFSSFRSNIQGFSVVLSQLAADKGLANYDKRNQLETILKDVVNLIKDMLKTISDIIHNDPSLAPVFGRIFDEIKCIIIDNLDISENLTDGLLNVLLSLSCALVGLIESQLKGLGMDI